MLEPQENEVVLKQSVIGPASNDIKRLQLSSHDSFTALHSYTWLAPSKK